MKLFIMDDAGREAIDEELRCYAKVGGVVSAKWYRVYGVRAIQILTKYAHLYPEKKLDYDRIRLLVRDQVNQRLAEYEATSKEEVAGCGIRWWESASVPQELH